MKRREFIILLGGAAVGKDWRDCRIAHPGRIGCTVRRPRR
jgi:hypothetical protein